MSTRAFRLAFTALFFLSGIGLALAAQNGTTGTEKRFQQSGVKVGLLEQVVNTATATAGAATLNSAAGVVTSEALTTAAGADYTLTITDNEIAAGDVVLASVQNGTNTTVEPAITRVTPAAGSVVVIVRNLHATVALNGTIKVSFFVVKNSALDAD